MIWRETGETARIGFGGFGVDARAGFLIIIWAIHFMWLTFLLMIGVMGVLGLFAALGMTAHEAWRRIRRGIAGKIIYITSFDRIMS